MTTHSGYTVHTLGITVTTTVTSSPSVIDDWLQTTLYHRRGISRLVVGMGVQWLPNSYSAATLQLCIGRSCLIIQLSHAPSVPPSLRHFLRNRDYTFVGVWNHSDARRLEDCRHALRMNRWPLDVRHYVAGDNGEGLTYASFERIVEEFLGFQGVRLEKHISMSDWEATVLSKEQVQQATVDAYVAFVIGRNIRAWEIVEYIESD